TPRSLQGAVIEDADAAVAQAVQIVTSGNVDIRTGGTRDLRADTLCVHGDRPDAALFARKLREALSAAGVKVAKLAD
ncbi:MAG: LamB/YcsF family protein, partial [Rudaea sp.]